MRLANEHAYETAKAILEQLDAIIADMVETHPLPGLARLYQDLLAAVTAYEVVLAMGQERQPRK